MNFHRIASVYRTLETLRYGNKLQACRLAGLSWIKPPQHALLAGEGDGRFLLAFLERFPQASVHVVDASQAMLQRARQRVTRSRPQDLARIRFECATLGNAAVGEACLSRARYDLLVTHFFLDCFGPNELSALLPELSRCIAPQGQWLHADFHLPERGWSRRRAKLWLAIMYRFFAITAHLKTRELVDVTPRLRELGWSDTQVRFTDHDFLRASLWTRALTEAH